MEIWIDSEGNDHDAEALHNHHTRKAKSENPDSLYALAHTTDEEISLSHVAHTVMSGNWEDPPFSLGHADKHIKLLIIHDTLFLVSEDEIPVVSTIEVEKHTGHFHARGGSNLNILPDRLGPALRASM